MVKEMATQRNNVLKFKSKQECLPLALTLKCCIQLTCSRNEDCTLVRLQGEISGHWMPSCGIWFSFTTELLHILLPLMGLPEMGSAVVAEVMGPPGLDLHALAASKP